MKVLITGGGGFIGSHLAERLLAEDHEVLAIDNFATGRRDNLTERDGTDPRRRRHRRRRGARTRSSPTSAPRPSPTPPPPTRTPTPGARTPARTRSAGPTWSRAAREAEVERIVYFQTALCYGTQPLEQPITLEHPIRPDSSYAISKTTAEQYIELSGIPWVSLRLANIYGPRNLSGPPPTFYQRLTEGKPCFVMDTRRDFIFVDDLIDVVAAALGGTGEGAYHVSTGSDYSIKEMFDAVTDAMGVEIEEEVEVRPRPRTTRPASCSTPRGRRRTSAGRRVPLEEGSRRRSSGTGRTASARPTPTSSPRS